MVNAYVGSGKLPLLLDNAVNVLMGQKFFDKKIVNECGFDYAIEFTDKTRCDLPDYCNGEHFENIIAKLALDGYQMSIETVEGNVNIVVDNGKKTATACFDKPTHLEKAGELGYMRAFCEAVLETSGVDPDKNLTVYVDGGYASY